MSEVSYRCPSCGYRSPKWMGFCPQCRAQEGLVEEVATRRGRPARSSSPVGLDRAAAEPPARIPVGIGEVDRVLGGGLVPGAAILLGGEPGVGKSTLILQLGAALAGSGRRTLVVSAEESVEQVGLRARRLGAVPEEVLLLAEPDIDAVLATAAEAEPDLLVVDSIQTVMAPEVGSSPGGVAQVRECAARVVRFGKERGIATVLVGHVTKEGGIAGPKLVEHTVDVVLYLEGDLEHGLRVLRGLKNRFGATHVVGVFEMGERGLVEVTDPSAALIGDWEGTVPGTVVFPAMEGRRPVLVEVQALVSTSQTPQPRRSVKGLEPARLHQILAVLERHAQLSFAGKEVYVSVVGGVRVREPASDLPVALALASSLLDRPLGAAAAWGEVGLTGEVRAVPHQARRREEAARVGVTSIIAPDGRGSVRLHKTLIQAGLLADTGTETTA